MMCPLAARRGRRLARISAVRGLIGRRRFVGRRRFGASSRGTPSFRGRLRSTGDRWRWTASAVRRPPLGGQAPRRYASLQASIHPPVPPEKRDCRARVLRRRVRTRRAQIAQRPASTEKPGRVSALGESAASVHSWGAGRVILSAGWLARSGRALAARGSPAGGERGKMIRSYSPPAPPGFGPPARW